MFKDKYILPRPREKNKIRRYRSIVSKQRRVIKFVKSMVSLVLFHQGELPNIKVRLRKVFLAKENLLKDNFTPGVPGEI